jgi:(R,R)-butanediol dehydrogenase / meso-butanediol dehydrogenase / diacetyl reductase
MLTKLMRAVIFNGEGDLSVGERAIPKLVPGKTLIEVALAGICATDREVFSGRIPGVKSKVILGHEITGLVVAGDESADIQIGNRVVADTVYECGECSSCKKGTVAECSNPGELGFTADGGWGQYVLVDTSRIHKIPDHLSFEESVITEPFVIPFGALLDSKATIKDKRILVVGGGLAAVAFASSAIALGASRVDVSLRTDRRNELFTNISPKINLTTSGHLDKQLADLSIDSVGNTESIATAISGIKNSGQVICYGFSSEFANNFPIAEVVLRNIRLSGHTNSSGKWPALIEMLTKGTVTTKGLVDRIITPEEVPDAIANWRGNLRTAIRFN